VTPESFLPTWDVSGDDREKFVLFKRISVLLFRFNSVLLYNSFELDDRPEKSPFYPVLLLIFSYPRYSSSGGGGGGGGGGVGGGSGSSK